MNLKEFKQQSIDLCREASFPTDGIKYLLNDVDLSDHAAVIRGLLSSLEWCIKNKIYTAETLLQLEEQDLLLEAGLKTQINTPIDFQPEEIGGVTWKPYNEGAVDGNWEGDYMSWDEAYDPDSERIIPTPDNTLALSKQKVELTIHQNQFGYLFDGRLFFPAGGYILEIPEREPSKHFVGCFGNYWLAKYYRFAGCGASFSFHCSYTTPVKDIFPDGPSLFVSRAQVRCLQD